MSTVTNGSVSSKVRSKPARTVRLLLSPFGPNPGVIRLTVGTDSAEYLLTPLSSDFGTAFRLLKQGSDETHDVNLDLVKGEQHTCSCKGFARWHHCKHTAGLVALIASGQLPAGPAPATLKPYRVCPTSSCNAHAGSYATLTEAREVARKVARETQAPCTLYEVNGRLRKLEVVLPPRPPSPGETVWVVHEADGTRNAVHVTRQSAEAACRKHPGWTFAEEQEVTHE